MRGQWFCGMGTGVRPMGLIRDYGRRLFLGMVMVVGIVLCPIVATASSDAISG